MKINDHCIDTGLAEFIESNKTSGLFSEGLPDTLILHYTAGGNANSAIDTFTRSPIKASAHLVVDRDGTVTQLVPFDTIAWHAGKSAHEDRTDLNKYSIGVEMVNAGRLQKNGADYVSWFGKTYPESEVVRAVHRNETTPGYWHRYTEEQIGVVFELCTDLMVAYNIKYILGHEEISPGHKTDPGPAFPLDKIRDRLIYGDRSNIQEDPVSEPAPGVVTASLLNVRSGPSVQNPTIANPLSRHTRVNILDETDEWYQVEVTLRGWVSKKYIKRVS